MRIIIFGIDGLTMRIMGPLIKNGTLPHFRDLLDEGNIAAMNSVIPPLTPPSWASLFTGKNPGKHGLFEFRKRRGYSFSTNTCWDYDEASPFWEYLSDRGFSSVLLNVPLYYPPLNLKNCVSVSGFPALESMGIFYPRSLRQEFRANIPDYRIDTTWRHDLPEGQEDMFIDGIIELTEARIRAMKYLMNKKPWDLFFAVFTGTDRLQHFFWDEIMSGHQKIMNYYAQLDDALRYVMEQMGDDDYLFVVSDHGFCPIKLGVNINLVLQAHGLIEVKKTVELPINYVQLKKIVDKIGISSVLKKLLPAGFIGKCQEHSKVEGAFSFSKIRWSRTKAFGSSGLFGGISVNVKGREPEGIVGENERNDIQDKLIRIFSKLEKDGSKVIKKAYRREEVYSGKFMDEMPDVILLAESGFRFDETIDSGDIFREPRDGKARCLVVGEHERETLFIMKKKNMKKCFGEISVIDIAPSILHLFDIPIPSSMDGKSLFEDQREPNYIDEMTGVIYKKQQGARTNISRKLKKLRS